MNVNHRIDAIGEEVIGRVLPLSGRGIKRDILTMRIRQLLEDFVKHTNPKPKTWTDARTHDEYAVQYKRGWNKHHDTIKSNVEAKLNEKEF